MDERTITIEEVLERRKDGSLLECFTTGTAAIIGSVKNIEYKGVDYEMPIDEHLQAGIETFKIRK